MTENEVSAGGMLVATVIALLATIGVVFTEHRMDANLGGIWLGLFAISLLTLAGAVVNFDPKRLIK